MAKADGIEDRLEFVFPTRGNEEFLQIRNALHKPKPLSSPKF